TQDVAAATVALIAQAHPGTYHVTNSGSCSWNSFACAIFELAGLGVEVAAISSKEYGAPARRPAYSVLAVTGMAQLGLPAPRAWREALAAYLELRRERLSRV